jgi:hypothetical protein
LAASLTVDISEFLVLPPVILAIESKICYALIKLKIELQMMI